MKKVWVIWFKEIRALILSPTFFILAALLCAIWSYSFFRNLIQFAAQSSMAGSPYLQGVDTSQFNIHYSVFSNHISLSHILFLFVVSALQMRLFTEERKLGTFSLLSTYPVTSFQIVWGKFCASQTVIALLCFISFLYPALSIFVVKQGMPWELLLSSYLGLYLMASLYSGIALFSSALTKSPALAVVVGLMMNLFVLLIFGQLYHLIDSPIWRSIFEHVSFAEHFISFIKGSLSLVSFVCLLSVSLFFVFLTERVVEVSRWR